MKCICKDVVRKECLATEHFDIDCPCRQGRPKIECAIHGPKLAIREEALSWGAAGLPAHLLFEGAPPPLAFHRDAFGMVIDMANIPIVDTNIDPDQFISMGTDGREPAEIQIEGFFDRPLDTRYIAFPVKDDPLEVQLFVRARISQKHLNKMQTKRLRSNWAPSSALDEAENRVSDALRHDMLFEDVKVEIIR